jgi:hypothetical protein
VVRRALSPGARRFLALAVLAAAAWIIALRIVPSLVATSTAASAGSLSRSCAPYSAWRITCARSRS